MNKKRKYSHWKLPELKELRAGNLRGLLSAFTSLRVRNYRLYFIGQCISLAGRWIQSIAMSWLVYNLTGSIVMLATVAFINQIPQLILGPVAGVMSDRYNRFNIMLTTQAVLMASAFVLAYLTFSETIVVWHILVVSVFSGIASAIEAPARQSFYTKLVPPAALTNAIALNSVSINGTRFIGPALGGILIGAWGEAWCFLINGMSFIAVFVALFMLRLEPFTPSPKRENAFRSFREGVGYVRGFLPLKVVILCVGAISFFGMPFLQIVPALVRDTLDGDSVLLGAMNSAIGAGAVTAALYLAARKRIQGLGKVLTITAVLLGSGLVLLSFVEVRTVAILIAYPIGCGLIGTLATSNTLLQSLVEDDKRGRVMSFFNMATAGLTPLGGMLYGFVAEHTSLTATIAGSGVICLAAGIVYEQYRPKVRAAVRDRTAHGRIVDEIAHGIDAQNPF